MNILRSDWPQLLALVEQALDVHPAARARWVESLELTEPISNALLQLLNERQVIETDDFLGAMPSIGATSLRITGEAAPGEMVGPWRLLQEIGQGGMSTVWLAERADNQVTRQVALKLPHAGPGQALLASRLLRERNILAALEHPNIGRLYDVGMTDQGTPYLVMEYIRGETLLKYANSNRLSVFRRLALFQQVLCAVQYAHGKLVLHRDLKPGNILVDDSGVVKLLDFGIARELNTAGLGEAALTQRGSQVMTPEYAAPEQVAALPLGTGCDIYALGVILFELLTDERPYTLASGDPTARSALEAAILSGPTRRPSDMWRRKRDARAFSSTASSMSRALRGDLDVIVSKALRKKPEERYLTADAFAADLQRHMHQRPIEARPPSRWYQARKFIQRHYRSLGATLATFTALGIGIGATWAWTQRDDSYYFGFEGWHTNGWTQLPGNCGASQGDEWLSPTTVTVRCLMAPNRFFGAMRKFSLDESLRGRRAVLTGQVRLSSIETSGFPWLRADTQRGGFSLDNYSGESLRLTTEWQAVSLEVLVPHDATDLVGGIMLEQAGEIQVKNFVIEARDRELPVLARMHFLDHAHPETPADFKDKPE